jgi:hypothetical protein
VVIDKPQVGRSGYATAQESQQRVEDNGAVEIPGGFKAKVGTGAEQFGAGMMVQFGNAWQ